MLPFNNKSKINFYFFCIKTVINRTDYYNSNIAKHKNIMPSQCTVFIGLVKFTWVCRGVL
jgi:hypothetical protein